MPKDYGLVTIVENDGSLERDEKMAFISLAKEYEENFKENLDKTSLDLDDDYGTNNPALWQKFLTHTSVRRLINDYLLETAEKKANKALGEMSTKALKVKDRIDKERKREDNTNIIVMLMRPKEEEDESL